ncbi:uncharacterized protein LOC111360535 [Spodoptera litura]|uniref:Uncharacterized protein LOC111360535 n=1 Tax=Spodoptera litura TaxID=69820 RepID=A0A9J7EP71_SPOLT|nr:uncharacterized protein LOC111360535 [Spodoptera litura]
MLTLTALQNNIQGLTPLYMPMNLNTEFHKSKVTAVNKLHYILSHTNRKLLQEQDFKPLLLCSLTLVYYFGMRIKLNRLISKYWHWCGRRRFHQAETAFQITMDMLLPECNEATIKTTLKFFSDVQLWSFESFVEQILEVLLFFDRGKTTLFNMMLTDIHYVLFIDMESVTRHRMRVLYNLLKSSNWVIENGKLLPFVTRLLDFFAYSVSKDDGRTTQYRYLRKGFEVCLRRIFERVENKHRKLIITTMLNWFSMVNMNQEHVLEFSTLLDHAAEFYQVGIYKDSFGQGLIEHVLVNLVGSSNATNSLVGCRLMLKFLDRQHNSQYLVIPTLFYEFSQVRLKVGDYDIKDKLFIRYHREKLNNNLLKAIKRHGTNIVNLKTIYTIVCCMVLEVPCGLTAAAAACIVMAIQDQALNGENIPAPCRYWLHAVVVSIMSLICWVHKAPVLYTYVNHIVARRAKEAPQLNPPLMYFYKIGRHHVTWNKPTLFFEDWELRYALWKHFQDTRTTPFAEQTITRKVPSLDLQN